jgi:hypothetical protein
MLNQDQEDSVIRRIFEVLENIPQFDSVDKRQEVLAQFGININVTQNIQQMAEGAQAFGVYIGTRGATPEQLEEIKQLLNELIASHKTRVFISSTRTDLQKYRRIAIEHITRSELWTPHRNVLDDFPTGHQVDICLGSVIQSKVFIGIYGERYGSLPDTLSEKPKTSYTEQEFQQAREKYKRCLCFLSRPGTQDLILPVPERRLLPKPLDIKIPPFKSQQPKGFKRILATIYARYKGKETPKLLLQRELYRYKRTVNIVQSINSRHAAEYEKEYLHLKNEYEAALAEYHFQKTNQDTFRKKIISFLPVSEFGSEEELVKQLENTLNELYANERTGFVNCDIEKRWIKWSLQEKGYLRHQLLRWKTLLPSPIEYKTTSEAESILDSFINDEWHEKIKLQTTDIQKCAEDAHEALKNILKFDLPDKILDELFSKNYLQVNIVIRTWCELHQKQLITVKNKLVLINDWKELVHKIIESKLDVHKVLHGKIKSSVEKLNALVNDLTNDLWLGPLIQIPAPLPEGIFVQRDDLIKFEIEFWIGRHLEAIHKVDELINLSLENVFKLLDHWEEAIESVWEEALNPHYNRCLLITGRSGSGKTHLLARFFDCTEKDIYTLLLSKEDTFTDLETLILNKAGLQFRDSPEEPSGPKWKSLAELDKYLSGQTVEKFGPKRLLIVIDRLEEWVQKQSNFIPMIGKFIENATSLHSIYWVITISEYAIGYVVDHDFWRTYGYMPSGYQIVVPGWLSLDSMNDKHNVWIPIFKENHEPPIIDQIQKELSPMSRQLLNIPFIAWVIAELKQQGRPIEDLFNFNFFDFVRNFWTLRLDEIAIEFKPEGVETTIRPEIEQGVLLIAERIAKYREEEFAESLLPELLITWEKNKAKKLTSEMAKSIVEALTAKSLLISSYNSDALEKEPPLKIGVLPFWQYWGAAQLCISLKKQHYDLTIAQKIITNRFEISFSTDEIVPGMFEFFLLWIDNNAFSKESLISDDRSAAAKCIKQIVQYVILEKEKLRSNIWLVAAKASSDLQRELGFWLLNQPLQNFKERQELLHYMYFIKNIWITSADIFKPHLRIKLLQPYYPKIGDYSLQEYFQSMLENILPEWLEEQEYAKSVAYLLGSEAYLQQNYHENVGARFIALTTLDGKIEWNKFIHLILVMLVEISKIYDDRENFQLAQSETDEREKLWSYVIQDFCSRITKKLNLECIELMDENGWFSWSRDSQISQQIVVKIMEEQFTTSLGQWFRDKDRANKDNFIKMVEQMVTTENAKKKITVIFLIYHTISNKKLDAKIDDRLWPILKDLHSCQYPEIQRVWRFKKLNIFYENQLKYFSN